MSPSQKKQTQSTGKKTQKKLSAVNKGKQVKVTLKRSLNGVSEKQKQTVACLGLKKINQNRLFTDSPAFRGQVKKIKHLLQWEKL